jgi:type IV pilus assembly protein PilY1
MKLSLDFLPAAIVLGASIILPCTADDTDLFLSPGGSDGVGVPQVLIVLDNTANWSQSASGDTKFAFEKGALKAFFDGLEVDRFKVGLELFAESGRPNSNTKGGYIRKAIQLMNETNRSALSDLISSLDRNGDKADAAFYATSLHEAYLYYSGKEVYVGTKAKADLNAFVTAQTLYRSPIGPSDTCAKKYVVFISNGPPDNGENTSADDLLKDLGGILDTDPIRLAPSGKQANWADEYSRFLKRQGIVTYTIEIIPEQTGQGPDNTALGRLKLEVQHPNLRGRVST